MAANDPRLPGRFTGIFVPVWLRLFAIVIGIVIVWNSQREQAAINPPPEAPASVPETQEVPESQEEPESPSSPSTESPKRDPVERPPAATGTTVSDVTLKDQSGRVIYTGDIDLQPTLDRIAAGKRLERFSHDGSTFQNRERKLPKQKPGYYKEYVVVTPKVGGPGPQRLIIGEAGEVYYTHDHYRTFRRIR